MFVTENVTSHAQQLPLPHGDNVVVLDRVVLVESKIDVEVEVLVDVALVVEVDVEVEVVNDVEVGMDRDVDVDVDVDFVVVVVRRSFSSSAQLVATRTIPSARTEKVEPGVRLFTPRILRPRQPGCKGDGNAVPSRRGCVTAPGCSPPEP